MNRGSALLIGAAAAILALLAGIHTASQRSDFRLQVLPAVAEDALTRLFAARLEDVDGKSYAFSNWQGKTLVVNFWATWCPPCRDEIPAFSRLQALYAPQGVQFVGIALDSADSVRTFAGSHPASYPLVIGGALGVDLARQLGNTGLGLPYTLVIGPDREPRLIRLGPLSESELDLFLRRTLSR